LSELQLNIRRIRSNVDDHKTFQSRVPYIPESLRFTVSEPELLKLLMGPLYGENPLYGLRELTQNSVDSVIELDHLKATGTHVEGSQLKLDSGVQVELTEGPEWSLTIKDQGTGMSLDIIKELFSQSRCVISK
jgi:molecular chaperone HtpG